MLVVTNLQDIRYITKYCQPHRHIVHNRKAHIVLCLYLCFYLPMWFKLIQYPNLHYFCNMLNEKEKQFLTYWESEREKQNTMFRKILNGLPMAALFSLPILLFIFAVYLFFPEWYTRVSNTSSGSFITIIIAVFLCMIFFSYFRMNYKREMNEQLYRELKSKEKKTGNFTDSK